MPIIGSPITPGNEEGWIGLSEAEEYFASRLHSEFWTTSGSKAAALMTAQRDIESSPDFTFTEEDKAAPTKAMKHAVCEQAFFRLLDPDIDTRASLIAQGVTVANLVMEEYRTRHISEGIPIGMKARQLLSDYLRSKKKIHSVHLYRKESQ